MQLQQNGLLRGDDLMDPFKVHTSEGADPQVRHRKPLVLGMQSDGRKDTPIVKPHLVLWTFNGITTFATLVNTFVTCFCRKGGLRTMMKLQSGLRSSQRSPERRFSEFGRLLQRSQVAGAPPR
jgi:hypothetical protein